MRYMISICLPCSPLKVNINAFLGLFLKQSPSNLLFSKVFQGNNRKVSSPAVPFESESQCSHRTLRKRLTAGIRTQADLTSSCTGKGSFRHRWTCLRLQTLFIVNTINICHLCCRKRPIVEVEVWFPVKIDGPSLFCKLLTYESLHAVIKSV